MSNPDTWEKRLQCWSPRAPSEKVAERLFETRQQPIWKSAIQQVWKPALHGFELWHWLTPVAACCLTVAVLCTGMNRREVSGGRDNATFIATVMFNAASSNVATQTFELSKGDENIQWNVWPHATLPTTNFSFAQTDVRPVSTSPNGIYP
jgi:hypothetical protein